MTQNITNPSQLLTLVDLKHFLENALLMSRTFLPKFLL